MKKSKTILMSRYTHQQRMDRITNFQFILLSEENELKTVRSRIKVKCLRDEYIWNTTLNKITASKGNCPRCNNKENYSEDRINELLKQRNIKLLSPYTNCSNKHKLKCLKDGYEWNAPLTRIITKDINSAFTGCPKCGGNARYDNDSFDDKIKDRPFKRIDDFINTSTPITFKCDIDSYEWKAYPSHILNGRGCPECSGQAPLTTEELNKRLEKANIILLDEYDGVNRKVSLKCDLCSNEWRTNLNHIFSSNTGCPECSKLKNEKEVGRILKEEFNLDILTLYGIKINGSNRRIDFRFHLNGKEYYIEYNGRQHYEPVKIFGGIEKFKIQQERDNDIRNHCKENKIILIEIPYHIRTTKNKIKFIKDRI